MKRLTLQRWALMVLLLTRLVMGQFSHAMPMSAQEPGAHEEAAGTAVESQVHCADHESGAMEHDDAVDTKPTDSMGEHDCCKTGECECPCLHAPCLLSLANLTFFRPDIQRHAVALKAPPQQPPFGLFRPPARLS